MRATAYIVSKDSKLEPKAVAGSVIYASQHYDYGLASEDTAVTGIEHRSFTLDPEGGYPFFTMPMRDVILRDESGDGVALTSASHPVPRGWSRVGNWLLRAWRWLTWPIRKHRVIETIEIELPNRIELPDRVEGRVLKLRGRTEP